LRQDADSYSAPEETRNGLFSLVKQLS